MQVELVFGFLATYGINRVVEILSDLLKQTPLPDGGRQAVLRVVPLVLGIGAAFVLDASQLFANTQLAAFDPVIMNILAGASIAGGANGWNWLQDITKDGNVPGASQIANVVRRIEGVG